ncbi:MAG: hypothetical protein LBL57_07355 [Tannerella sp.]|nr:hypothetical protein [Tannerella sp.]
MLSGKGMFRLPTAMFRSTIKDLLSLTVNSSSLMFIFSVMDRTIPHPDRNIAVKDGNIAIRNRKVELGNSN